MKLSISLIESIDHASIESIGESTDFNRRPVSPARAEAAHTASRRTPAGSSAVSKDARTQGPGPILKHD
jgi:hypothetical protein